LIGLPWKFADRTIPGRCNPLLQGADVMNYLPEVNNFIIQYFYGGGVLPKFIVNRGLMDKIVPKNCCISCWL